jgi:hypothetical protein
MSYYVNRSDGNIAAVVEDGTLNTQTTLKLIGVGYANYAEVIAENFVDLMESFAGYNPPPNPLAGQLWYNKSSLQMQVFDGDVFLPVNNVKISSATPTNSNPGDFWYNSDDMQLLYLRGDQWQVIAPPYKQSQGRSEVVVETLYELNGTDHTATVVYASGLPILIISSDSRYQPHPYIEGYNWINPGINIPSYAQTQNGIFWGGNGNAYASSGITVGGSTGQLQFNNSGFFGGATGLTTNGINLQSTGTISATTITGAGLTSTVSGIRFPDNTVQTTAGVNNPYVLTGNGSVFQVPYFDSARNLTSTAQITTDGLNLTLSNGFLSASEILIPPGGDILRGITFADGSIQYSAAFNNSGSVDGTGSAGQLAYFTSTTNVGGTSQITTNGSDLTLASGLLKTQDIELTYLGGGGIIFADRSVQSTAAINFSQVQSDWNITDNTQTSFIKNKPTNIQISYPTSIISNSNFSWGVIRGIPNETWYATTNLPAPYNRIPSSGTYPLDSNGATSYTNGYFGDNTGDVEVTFNFSQSGKIIKRLNIISSTQISYPTVVPTSSSNFRWRIFNGYPNDSWYATYGLTSNPTQFRVPTTGTNSLNSLGQISYTNGSFPGITGPADVEVIFYFTLSGIVIKRVYVLG